MSQADEGCANKLAISLWKVEFSNLETLIRCAKRKGGAAQGTSVERDYGVYQKD
jgi:hypothetical protein